MQATQQRPGNGTQQQTAAPKQASDQMDAVLIETERNLTRLRDRIESAPAGLARMAATSMAVQQCKKLVTPAWIEQYVMPLMNSPLGFMTDHNGAKGPNDFYRAEDLVNPIVECLIRGFALTGNEFNVISGRFYGAQNGYRRLFRELPGVTDLEELAGEPIGANGNTTVRFIVRCKVNGKPYVLKNEAGQPGRKFTIKVNNGMGPDAIVGKAARKAFKAAYEELTGTPMTESDEPDVADASNGTLPAAGSIDAAILGNETKPDPVEEKKPLSEAEQLAREDALDMKAADLLERINDAMSITALQKVGEAMKAVEHELGETRYTMLTAKYQAASAAIAAKKK